LLPGALLGLLASLALPGLVLAHAGYQSSDPAAGAILKTAPTVVTVHFLENVDPTGSEVEVYDAKLHEVSTASAQVSRTGLKTMTVPMKGNGSETYLVVWHNVSAQDGDPDAGAFTFLVNPSGTLPKGASNQSATASNSNGAPGWVVAVVGVAGLIIGGLGGLLLGRRQ
jgi:methionine-rich copper-binding protein CopC